MISNSKISRILSGENPSNFVGDFCLSPRDVFIHDSFGRSYGVLCDCGTCYKCRDRKRNEWATRMALHSFSYKHIYFITLTYGSYNLNDYCVHPFKNDWLLTFPSFYDTNTYRKMQCSPVVLRIEHLQKFLKRLRKAVDDPDLSYCACGEYGEKYYRPHYHIILFSNKIISYSDICTAWSYDCVSFKDNKYVYPYRGQKNGTRFRFLIGRVNYHDLVSNGSLDWSATGLKPAMLQRSAYRNFSYVAKYVGKSNSIPPAVLKRIKSAYYHSGLPRFDYLGDMDKNDFDSYHSGLLFGTELPLSIRYSDCYTGNIPNLIEYKRSNIYYHNVSLQKFTSFFKPFFVCSRAKAIGLNYFVQNYERFANKNRDLPLFCGKKLVFPTFFLRLLKKTRFPFFFKSKSNESYSLVRGFIPAVKRIYRALLDSPDSLPDLLFSYVSSHFLGKASSKFHFDEILRPILYTFNSCITYLYDNTLDLFVGYKYDKKSKEYYKVEYCDRPSFCQVILSYCDTYYKESDINFIRFQSEKSAFNVLSADCSYRSLLNTYILKRDSMQANYNTNHNNFIDL